MKAEKAYDREIARSGQGDVELDAQLALDGAGHRPAEKDEKKR